MTDREMYDLECRKNAALTRCMREVAEELRRLDGVYVTDDEVRSMAKQLEAALAANYSPGPKQSAEPEQKKRVELGCHAIGQCFCTGRCKRTQEEQDAYEKRERAGFGLHSLQLTQSPYSAPTQALAGNAGSKGIDTPGGLIPPPGPSAAPERCGATHTGEQCIKPRGHSGWHQTPGNVHITWPDPEPHVPAETPEQAKCACVDCREGHPERHLKGEVESDGHLMFDVVRLTKERDEARAEANYLGARLASHMSECTSRSKAECAELRAALGRVAVERDEARELHRIQLGYNDELRAEVERLSKERDEARARTQELAVRHADNLELLSRLTEKTEKVITERDELRAEVEQRTSELQKCIDVADKHGWDGVENSKLLWAFFDGLGDDVDALSAEQARLIAEVERLTIERDSAKGLYDEFKRTVDRMVITERGNPKDGEYPGTCAQLEILLEERRADVVRLKAEIIALELHSEKQRDRAKRAERDREEAIAGENNRIELEGVWQQRAFTAQREIERLKSAITELHANWRTVAYDHASDDDNDARLVRRNEHLLEVCGVAK